VFFLQFYDVPLIVSISRGIYYYPSTFAGSATRCLIKIKILLFTFGNKNNNILQLVTILHNEAGVLESFFQVFGIEGKCFQNFRQFQK